MSQNRTDVRRTRSRRAEESRSIWLDRAWRFVTRLEFVGILMAITGAVLLLGPTAAVPRDLTETWWVSAYRFADAIQAGASLMAVAAVAAAASFVKAWFATRSAARNEKLRLAGIGLMGLGLFVGTFVWFAAQASLPTSRVSVPPGQTIQSFRAVESGRAFKVMLPTRVHLVSVSPEQSRATIELRKPGEDEGIRNDVFVGDPLAINEFRFALVGLEMDPRVRAAVLAKEGGIDARGTVGSTVRFEPDGPAYRVRQIVTDYLGVMGPAVELETEERGRFWVFQRENELDVPLHDIRLRRLETSPVAVFAVSKADLGSGAAAAAILFVVGLALFLFASHRARTWDDETGEAA